MPYGRILLALLGISTIIVAVAAGLWAKHEPRRISYSVTGYYGEAARDHVEPPQFLTPKFPANHGEFLPVSYNMRLEASNTVSFTIILLIVFLVVSAIFQGFGKSVESGGAGTTITVMLVSFALGATIFYGNKFMTRTPKTKEVVYGDPRTDDEIDWYVAFAKLSGPDVIKFGESQEIQLELWMDKGQPVTGQSMLHRDKRYRATARVQAVNFDVDRQGLSDDDQKPLVADGKTQWSWVISPKEKRLGRQTIVAEVLVSDGDNEVTRPYLRTQIEVTDPIGLPAYAYYLIVVFGTTLWLPLAGVWFKSWLDNQNKRKKDGDAADVKNDSGKSNETGETHDV